MKKRHLHLPHREAAQKLKREAGLIGLLYASIGSIIGSGWLFGPLHAAMVAGPYSVFSWVIGAGAILLLAFVFAELGTMFPNSGAIIHMLHVSHGNFIGHVWSWIIFLGSVTIPPIEVIAVLTYTNNFLPGLVYAETGVLTHLGFVTAVILLGIVVGLNFLAVRWVLEINDATTWWKLIIPILTIFIFMTHSFHPCNLAAHLSNTQTSGIFTAVSTAGVIFSFAGFQQAVTLAGETHNPGKYLPMALIGSVLITMFIYVGLQLAFILALTPEDIANGWTHLHFEGAFGPLAALSLAMGLFWWAVLLYADAIISPLGTAFIYTTAMPRIIMAAGEMGNAPAGVAKVNRFGVPWVGLVITYVLGVLFFFPFPSWQKLVSATSCLIVMGYSLVPIILLHLRRVLPHAPRPFRLRFSEILCPCAFIVANWIIYWTGYSTLKWLFLIVASYVFLYLAWHFLVKRKSFADLGFYHSGWIVPYFVGLWIISYLGPDSMGGFGMFNFFTGMWILVPFSLIIFYVAIYAGHDAKTAEAISERLKKLASRGVEEVVI